MTTLFLDLGTNCGFAYGSHAGKIKSGTWDLSPSRFESPGMRLIKFVRQLDELHGLHKIKYVGFEKVHQHRGTAAAHVYGALSGRLMEWCDRNSIPFEGLGVQEIKIFAAGKGGAKKEQVVEGVRRWGFSPKTEDEADAIAGLMALFGKDVMS